MINNNTQSAPESELLATVESTGNAIFKIPESPTEVLVTGSALIAILIIATYLKRFFR
ncbi:hypothetical protein MGP2080_06162 [marine gamma proteobacterium HTCC2080]|nr:hypothetical protein MGP2080_06162 [marine gamma proteobacterium HTCC2080]